MTEAAETRERRSACGADAIGLGRSASRPLAASLAVPLLCACAAGCSAGDEPWSAQAISPAAIDGASAGPEGGVSEAATPSTPAEAATSGDDGGGPTGSDAGPDAAPGVEIDTGVPSPAAMLVIDSLTGDVTKHEVDAFLGFLWNAPIPTSQYPNAGHNYLADGVGGTTLEAVNRMFEIAGDFPGLTDERFQLLDLAIRWSDAWLSHRNDLPLGEKRVMWTGNVDPIWPPDAPPSTYAGCEVGQTVGILAYTALNIVKTPSLWNDIVPDGDPNGYGVTYRARAKTYETMLEYTMTKFFNKYFLNTTTLTIQRPNSAVYAALPTPNVNAWNREMMFLHAWQTLAEIHETLGDDPAVATMYGTITKNTVDMFPPNAQPRTAPDGTAVYDWGYGNFGDEKGNLSGEQTEIHAEYDMWGLTRAYRDGYTSATPAQMKTYADTIVHELMLSPGVYASYIDRCCSTATHDYLGSGFMFLAPYTTGLYTPAATADIQSGRQATSPDLTAGILWAKHYFAVTKTSP